MLDKARYGVYSGAYMVPVPYFTISMQYSYPLQSRFQN